MDYYRNLHLPEQEYAKELSLWFHKKTGTYFNIKNPRTFNEKIQWLKLYDSTELKTITTDKFLVREWVKERIGDKYLVPLIGVYDSFDEIDFSKLPNRFAMKTTHGSGWNYVVKDKSKININDLRAKFNKWLNLNFAFMYGFELHYKNIKPRIVIEEYIENADGKLWDYKFWCFNGEPKYIQFRDDWTSDLKMAFFDTDWNLQEFIYAHEIYDKELARPHNLEEMLHIAKTLCEGFIFTCVDLYRLDDGRIYFGEMTYTRSSGIANWTPKEWNLKLGELIKLPENKDEIMSSYCYDIKENEPKISIIMPVYKVENYLRKSVESLINQTLHDIEIICIDDESPDSCGEILDEYARYDSRVKVIHQKNSGQGSARNRGLEIARGKYIQFLDSDDTFDYRCCEKMYEVMENNDVDFACFGTNVVYETHESNKNIDSNYMSLKYKGKHKCIPAMARSVDVNCWSKIFKHEFLTKNEIKFPEKIHYEDVVFFWMCISSAEKIYFLNEKLINYVRREGSFMSELFEQKSPHLFDMIEAWKVIGDFLTSKEKLNFFAKQYSKMLSSNFFWALNCFKRDDIESKVKFLEKYSPLVDFVKDYALDPNEHQILNDIKTKKKSKFSLYKTGEYDEMTPIKDDEITIVFSTDRNYVAYLSVAIQSIIDNASEDKYYDIIVLNTDLYEYHKKFLLNMRKKNVCIRLFDMKKFVTASSINKFMTINHITSAAYYRLFIGTIFSNFKKILYLDCDLVVNCDISELYNTELGDFPIAATKDIIIANQVTTPGFTAGAWKNFRAYMESSLCFFDVSNYFNSGVLVIDIEKFAEFGLENLLDLAKRNTKFFHDQNVLNAAFQSNYLQLDCKWNYQWHIKFMSNNFKEELQDSEALMYLDCDYKPNIIHYTSHEKPWKNIHHTYADVWWKYARNSPFYEIILQQHIFKNVQPAKNASPSKSETTKEIKKVNIIKKIRYKILSKITFGKIRKKYKEKYRNTVSKIDSLVS